MVISVEPAHVDNAILPDDLTSEVALEQPEIGRSDQNIPINNHYTNDKRDFGIPGGSRNYQDDNDKSDKCNAIPTASRRRRPITGLERFDVGTSDINGSEGENGDDAAGDEDEEEVVLEHEQETFLSWQNGSVRVDGLHQSRQRHPGGGLLHARRQCLSSRCILPSECCFAVSSPSVGFLILTNTLKL